MADLIRKNYIYLGLLVGLVIIATVVSSGYSRDIVGYNYIFNKYGPTGWEGLSSELSYREPFILVASKIIYKLGLGAIFLFLVHSAISLPVKFYLIDKHSKERYLSLACFCSYFFILHDCTQIRFAMAIAFVYLGLHFLSEGKKYLFAAIVILSAAMFHVAALFFIVMLFFTTRKSMAWIFGLIGIAVLLYPVNLNSFLAGVLVGIIESYDLNVALLNKILNLYLLKEGQDHGFGLFNWRVLLVYFSVAVLYRYRDSFTKYELICYNSLLFSVFIYVLMKDVIEIQYRISGLFGFSIIFLVPYIQRWLSEYVGKRNSYIVLLSFFTVYLLKFAFYDKMIII